MLDGTGRTTTSASSPKIDTPASHAAVPVAVIRAANALNSLSKRKNGIRTTPIRTTQTTAQRIEARVSKRLQSKLLIDRTCSRFILDEEDGRMGGKTMLFRVGVAAALLPTG